MNIHSINSSRLLLFAAIAACGAVSLPANAQQRSVRGLPGTQSGVTAAHSQEARQPREEYDARSQEARQQRKDEVTAIQAHNVR